MGCEADISINELMKLIENQHQARVIAKDDAVIRYKHFAQRMLERDRPIPSFAKWLTTHHYKLDHTDAPEFGAGIEQLISDPPYRKGTATKNGPRTPESS